MLDRILLKREAKDIVRGASVSPYLFTLLTLVITFVLDAIDRYVTLDADFIYTYQLLFPGFDLSFLPFHAPFPRAIVLFAGIFVSLLGVILSAGQILYHLGIRQGREMPYSTLFDGFFFAGKIILLYLVMGIFIFLWTCLFIVPGLIAAYRYRFALYNLCENPEMGVMEALNMSKAQTYGFKGQLFILDLSFIGWLLLCGLTLGILSIWITPYIMQTNIGYFLQIKKSKGIGCFTEQSAPEDDWNGPDLP